MSSNQPKYITYKGAKYQRIPTLNENTLGLSDDMLIQLRKSNGIPELMLDKQSWESLYDKYGDELLKGDPRTVSYEDFNQEIENTGKRKIEQYRSMYEKMKSVSHKSRNIKSRDFQTTFNRYKDDLKST